MNNTQQEIEAILLNSECSPKKEVYMAFRAVVKFAIEECEATTEELHKMLNCVIREENDF